MVSSIHKTEHKRKLMKNSNQPIQTPNYIHKDKHFPAKDKTENHNFNKQKHITSTSPSQQHHNLPIQNPSPLLAIRLTIIAGKVKHYR
jgi:hypothetical protein